MNAGLPCPRLVPEHLAFQNRVGAIARTLCNEALLNDMNELNVVHLAHELDLLELAGAWRSEGRRVALATVVATWGSSPCPPGSQLLADDTRRFMGSVSGGCIEGEVVRRALEVIETDEPELLDFGVANEDAWSVGLSCGGRIQVFVEPVE